MIPFLTLTFVMLTLINQESIGFFIIVTFLLDLAYMALFVWIIEGAIKEIIKEIREKWNVKE